MKIKIIHTFFLAILCFTTATAQVAFNKNYQNTDGSGNWIASNLCVSDTTFFFNGGYSVVRDECNTYWSRGIFFLNIDKFGNIQLKKHFSFCDKKIYEGMPNSMIIDSDFFISCGGIEYWDTIKTAIYLTKLNNNFDTIFYNEYKVDTTSKRAWNLCKTYDGGYAICGGIDTTHNEYSLESTFVETFLFKTNANGDVLWEKKFRFFPTSDYCYNYGTQITQSADSGLVITGIYIPHLGVSRNFILKTDSLGNQQWVRFYGNSSYDNPGFSDIIATHDSCFLVCGSYTYGETFGGLYPYDGWLVKVDINGNTNWEKKYRDYVLNNTDWRDTINCKIVAITELNDHGFASIAMGKSNQCLSEEFSIYRFDSIGNLLWKKLFTEFPECTIAYHPNTIIQTDDLGFAIGGHIDHYEWNSSTSSWDYSQRLFLIKTDSLGNDTLLNDIAPMQSNPIREFKLICYPNPASSEFFIDLPQDFEDDIVEIYSTNGSLVYVQTVGYFDNRVDIDNLESGMYLLKLREKGLYGKLIIE